MSDENNQGVTILLSFTNSLNFRAIIDFDEPNDKAIQMCAQFLSLIEKGQGEVLLQKSLRVASNNTDPNYQSYLQKLLEYKSITDAQADMPAVLPREVFRKNPV